MTAVYPGSFDPVTAGHTDIISRAAKAADRLIVAVLDNPAKSPLFSAEERMSFLKSAIKNLPNVFVDSYSGMLAEYVLSNDIGMIIRGVRSYKDFEYESLMAVYNRNLSGGVDTWLLPSNPSLAHISGSAVKEVARLVSAGGKGIEVLESLVPQNVITELISRM